MGLYTGLCGLLARATLGQLIGPDIEILDKEELVTKGPYSRVRRARDPTYTSALIMALANALLFLHIVLVVGFLAVRVRQLALVTERVCLFFAQ